MTLDFDSRLWTFFARGKSTFEAEVPIGNDADVASGVGAALVDMTV